MILNDLRLALALRNVELYLDGDDLRYRAPEGALTNELRDAIRAHRMEIIEQFRNAATGRCCGTCDWRDWQDAPPQDGRIRTTCGKCGRFIGYRPVNHRMA